MKVGVQPLTGRVALVTGAGPNIGREIARTLALRGARVACNDIDERAAMETTAAVVGAGGEATAVVGDIVQESQVEEVVATVLRTFGRLDILVNNAAITVNKGLLDTSLAEWSLVIGVMLTGTFLMSRAAAKVMVAQGAGGCIVNIASTSGHRGRPNAVAYCTAKAGILNLTRAMAMDLVSYGIRVNSVSPTITGASVGESQPAGSRSTAAIPMGRIGRPNDQAAAVAFLASEEAGFITGEDLRVDGGSLATWGWRAAGGTV